MKPFGILLFLLLYALSSIGQNKFEPGYIIKQEGDTLRGFIQNAIEADLSKQVYFKPDSLSSLQLFRPKDILSFKIGRGIYQSMFFKNFAGEQVFEDTCFAKKLVKGRFDLYSFSRDQQLYFLIRTDTLTYFLYNTVFDGNGELIKPGIYLNVLNLISLPYDKSLADYARVGYNEKEMSRFIAGLNMGIAPEETENYYHKSKTKVEVYVFAGGLPLGKESQVSADAAVLISSPDISRHFFLSVGLQYLNSNTLSPGEWGGISFTWKLRQQVFSIPICFRYGATFRRIRPYAYVGVSAAYFNRYSDADRIKTHLSGHYFGMAFVVGIGVRVQIVKRLFAQVDYRYESALQHPAIGIVYQFK